MKIHPALLAVLILVPTGVAVLSLGLWVGTGDLRAMVRTADAYLNPPEFIVPDATLLVHGIQDLARLETASLQVEQRIRGQRGSDGSWSLLGERLDFVARGTVVAGVDLAKLGAEDLQVDEQGRVTVTLPPAEVWTVDVDEKASFVANRERGWLGWPDKDFETRVRREAERMLQEQAVREGLVTQADENAEAVVRKLLIDTGARDVHFSE